MLLGIFNLSELRKYKKKNQRHLKLDGLIE